MAAQENCKPRLILAPMAGVTDRAFRTVCREWGAEWTVSEMVSAKAMGFGDGKSFRLLQPAPGEAPFSVQLFGSDPQCMARAAVQAWERTHCQAIDLNMGCPAPKIVSNGDGCALMRQPQLAAEIIARVVQAVPLPVTVKFRKGWSRATENYLEFGYLAQQAGAAAVCLHGRTREQMYAGQADWQAVAQLKRALSIPVIANGDVFQPEDAKAFWQCTGADGIMIGRGALGNPFLFARAAAALEGQEIPPLPSWQQRMQTAARQIRLAAEDKGEHVAMLEARKHLTWYLKGIPGAKEYKMEMHRLQTLQQMDELLERMCRQWKQEGGT